MVENGFIASAYWAFMTCGHIPSITRETIYGDVHMYSHLAGGCYRKKTHEASLLQNRLHDLEERIQRNDRNYVEALAARDEEIAVLQRELACECMKKSVCTPTLPHKGRDGRLAAKLLKLERALISARQRARQAEADNETFKYKLKNAHQKSTIQPFCPAAESLSIFDPEAKKTQSPIRILYVGGRSGHIHHLKNTAEKNTAILVHHDGGMEDTLERMDPVVGSVDCVMCPIDCVSHSACLSAKRLCMKKNIPFLPLRTSSQSALCAAIQKMRTGMLV